MVIIVYCIIALLMGAFMVYCYAVKDPDFRDYIRDPYWWGTVTIMALLWPLTALQLLTLVIGRLIRYIQTIGL